MNEALANRIRKCPALPSLPAVALQVLELAQTEAADIPEIARVISRDPALSSKILRTVNSSFYGRSQSICTLNHALVVLGLQSVRTLVLGFSLLSNLKPQKTRGFKHLTYWRRSIYAATAARAIAARAGLVQQEECFLSALLMDLGMLVLDQVLGEEYSQICAQAPTHQALLEIERRTIDLTHAEAIGVLADQWKLPPLLAEPMRHHHEPDRIEDPLLRKLAEAVHLACSCADVFVEEQAAEPITRVRQLCAQYHQMNERQTDEMLEAIGQQTAEVAPMFEIKIASGANYEAILKKANETLVELTLKSQQELNSLSEQNQKLQVAATTDRLTTLANRARFDEVFAQAVQTALANNRPLSLLMIDLDRFKSINDTHGHQVGDHILSSLGQLLRSAARASDLPARYGGEELVLVLPDTPRATAAAVAESVRSLIASRTVRCGNKQIPVTASIGVATLEPGGPLSAPAHLLKAADLAVYAAKHSGRNCVRVFSLKSAAA